MVLSLVVVEINLQNICLKFVFKNISRMFFRNFSLKKIFATIDSINNGPIRPKKNLDFDSFSPDLKANYDMREHVAQTVCSCASSGIACLFWYVKIIIT